MATAVELSAKESDELQDRWSVYPDAELLFLLLGLHKMLELGQIRPTRRILQKEATLLGEVFFRWVPEDTLARGMAMFDGDEEPRMPDLDSLLEGESDDLD